MVQREIEWLVLGTFEERYKIVTHHLSQLSFFVLHLRLRLRLKQSVSDTRMCLEEKRRDM